MNTKQKAALLAVIMALLGFIVWQQVFITELKGYRLAPMQCAYREDVGELYLVCTGPFKQVHIPFNDFKPITVTPSPDLN